MLRAQLKLVFGSLVLGAIALITPAAAQAQQEVLVVNSGGWLASKVGITRGPQSVQGAVATWSTMRVKNR